jgi:hypothetical protein
VRKALIVGIDYYLHFNPLFGCVNDAHSVKAMLDRNANGSINFGTRLITGNGPHDVVGRHTLREAIRALFEGDSEIALLYFAGHGHIEATGGYLCAGECRTGSDGIPLAEIMTMASQSKAKNRIIVLDSCHSGIVGSSPVNPSMAELTEGTTILTASTAEQYADEENGAGVFTSLFVDALAGGAANLLGDVTPGGVYAHVDQSLGDWAQRPVFKTNVKTFVSLRKIQAPLELSDLQKISTYFPASGSNFQLDPSYEPERSAEDTQNPTIPPPDPDHTAIFSILQKYYRVGLVVPNDAPHMWHAAMDRRSCKLTALGEHYRRLASKGLI